MSSDSEVKHVQEQSCNNVTPMHAAVRHGHLEVLRLLLEAKADCDKALSMFVSGI